MRDDDHVCLCFRVSKRKVVSFCRREKPAVASLTSQCLAAGTGCGWCVPFLKQLHAQVLAEEPNPDLPLAPGQYAEQRASYRRTGRRDAPPRSCEEP